MLKLELLSDPAILVLGIYTQESESAYHTVNVNVHVHCGTIDKVQVTGQPTFII